MKLEDQVCSLELSKKLKDIGIKQDSLFYWERQYLPQIISEWKLMLGHQYNEYISAFAVAELGEMLPDIIRTENGDKYHCNILLAKNKSSIYYSTYDSFDKRFFQLDLKFYGTSIVENTEANARAKMLIYIIENNLVSDEWKNQWLIAV